MDRILELLVEKAEKYIHISKEQIDLERPFMEYGFDSRSIVQFVGDLEKELDIQLDMAALIDYPCINKLVNYLHEVLDKKKSKSKEYNFRTNYDKIAIIGMSCRFPKADNLSTYYENLKNKICSVVPCNESRLHLVGIEKNREEYMKAIYHGGYIDDIHEFDHVYFNLAKDEANFVDPQQRLLMQEIVHALEDAGIGKHEIEEERVGMFVGASNFDYIRKMKSKGKGISAIIGNAPTMLSNRMSYLFDFRGPSMTIDTACSSSLVAISEAINSLEQNSCDIAIAAGVNIILDLDVNTAFAEAGMLSQDGLCHTFDEKANGYVRGEGIGVVVLRRQKEAMRANNRIYATVIGKAINQDGRSASITAPNKNMQVELIQSACADAGIKPSDLNYIEAHGTGTLLGDYIEISAIDEAVNNNLSEKHELLIGSVKTNIGHLESAAGIASFIKNAYCLYMGNLVPTINVETINPKLNLEEKNIKVLLENKKIELEDFKCGISSFGFGGTNCHVIMERSNWIPQQYPEEEKSYYITPFSAISEEALFNQLECLRSNLEENSYSMRDLEYMLTKRKNSQKNRLCYVVENQEELVKEINNILQIKSGYKEKKNNYNITLLFSGQGTQWYGMGKQLEYFPAYKECFERCREKFIEIAHCDIREILYSENKDIINESYYAQPVIFAIQVSIAELLKNAGIEINCVCGHSLGEIAAAYVCGAISLNTAVKIIHYRSIILSRFTGKGKMLSVSIQEDQAKSYIEKYSNVSIGVINAKNSIVISGETTEVEQIKEELEREKLKCRYLPVNYAFHYCGIEKYKEELIEKLGKVKAKASQIKFVSTVTGDILSSKSLDAKYWADNMRCTVRFAQAAEKICKKSDIIIEIAPSSALLLYLNDYVSENFTAVTMQKRRVNPQKVLLQGIAELYKCGVEIQWDAINIKNGNVISLPQYQFSRKVCWLGADSELQGTYTEESIKKQFVADEVEEIIIQLLQDASYNDEKITNESVIDDLGFDSLKRFQINSKINNIFNVALTYSVFNSCVSVSDLIRCIEGYLDFDKEESGENEIRYKNIEEYVTNGQAAIVYDQFINKDSNKYNMSAAWNMEKDLNLEEWKKAYELVMNKYDIFHIRFFYKEKRILQKLSEEPNRLAIEHLEKGIDIQDYFNKRLNTAFELSREVVRGIVVEQGDNKYFGFAIHHSVIDGISMYIVLKEMIDIYYKLLKKENVVLQRDQKYFEFQVYQKKKTKQYADTLSHYKKMFAKNSFAKDYRISVCSDSKKSADEVIKIAGKLVEQLTVYSKKRKYTFFEILYGVYQILYYKITNERDFITCTYSSGRENVKFFDTVGYMARNIFTLCNVDPQQSFADYLELIHEKLLSEYKQEVEVTMKDILNNDSSFDGPKQVFVYEKTLDAVEGASVYVNGLGKDNKFYIDNMEFEQIGLACTEAQVNLVFMMEECNDSIAFRCQYREAVYQKDAIKQLMGWYVNLLENILADETLPIKNFEVVGKDEKQKVLEAIHKNNQIFNLKGICYHQYVEIYAQETPDKIAAIYEDESITYEQLNNKSNQIANLILKQTGGENLPVGIAVEKSIDFLIGIFGVMKAGAYYVPLDKNYPRERLQYIIDNSNMSYAITNGSFDDMQLDFSNVKVIEMTYQETIPAENLNRKISLQSGAYVIYTSGSTGKPKGVKVTHKGVETVVLEQERLFQVTSKDRVSFFASVCFDASVFDILMAIGHGATLVFAERGNMGTGEKLRAFFEEKKISVTTLPSSVLASMNNRDLELLRVIVTAGEPCSTAIKNKWCYNHKFFNAYGVTEATIWNTTSECFIDKPVYIGLPVANNELLVLNQDRNLCPQGVIGELYIGGICLAEGYIGLEEQNREKFLILGNEGKRYYRSGDLVRMNSLGEMEYIARADNQLKIRGFRIELEEIEKVIQNQRKIVNAIVVVINNNDSDQLVSFIELENEVEEHFVENLKKNIKNELPHYMIPSYFFLVTNWALTQNGKIDRKQMKQYAYEKLQEREVIPPVTEKEKRVVELLKHHVKCDVISMDDTLIQLGINSIKAYDLLAEIEQSYGIALKIYQVLNDISVKELVQLMEEGEKKEYKLLTMPKQTKIQLSLKQKGIWIQCKINKNTREFNIPVAIKIEGELDIDSLQYAFDSIVTNHDILRTRYYMENGEIYGECIEDYHYQIEFKDIMESDEQKRIEQLKTEINDMKMIPLAADKFPLYCVRLVKYGQQKYCFMVTMHHFISDGWSFKIFIEKLREYYNLHHRGIQIMPEPLAYQYHDIVYSQNQYMQDKVRTQEEYWYNKLEKGNYLIHLPEDYQRPKTMTHKGKNVYLDIGGQLFEKIVKFSKKHKTTKFNIITAVLGILLHKYSAQEEIVIGFPILCRENQYEREAIGMFIDTGILKLQVNNDLDCTEYIKKVSEEVTETLEMSKMGLNHIVEIVNPKRVTDTTQFFQVMINMVGFEVNPHGFDNLETSVIEDENQEAKYDFTFYITEESTHFNIKLNYYSDVYSEKTAFAMLQAYGRLMEQIILDDQKQIKEYVLAEGEQESKQELSYVQNDKLDMGFVQNVSKHGSHLCLKNSKYSLTYSEVKNKVKAFAEIMSSHGISTESCVGISGVRTPEFVMVILAVLSNDATYVVLDQQWKKERIKSISVYCKCTHLVNYHEHGIKVQKLDTEGLKKYAADCNYIGITSGTTGEPKCILGHNSAVNHFVDWEVKKFGLSEKDRFAIVSGISHDPILRDIFVPLSVGACIVFPNHTDLIQNDIFEYLEENKISVINLTPSIAEVILVQAKRHSGKKIEALRFVFFGGERLKKSIVREIMKVAPNCRVVNYYGTTETPQGVSWIEYDRSNLEQYSEYLPIGQGINDVDVCVVDSCGRKAEIGQIGNIIVRTKYLSKGYLNGKSDSVLRVDEGHEGTYETGDIGRYLWDGSIYVLGRKDSQVKRYGHRIELGEIESRLEQFEGIEMSKVIFYQDNLYAFVVQHGVTDLEECKEYMLRWLPSYMVPSEIIEIEQIPVTANGKTDMRKLEELLQERKDSSADESKDTEYEKIIRTIWKEVLQKFDFSVNQTFFDLGGTSMKLLILQQKLEQELNMTIEVADLFAYPTIKSFARYMEKRKMGTSGKETSDVWVAAKNRGKKAAMFLKKGRRT